MAGWIYRVQARRGNLGAWEEVPGTWTHATATDWAHTEFRRNYPEGSIAKVKRRRRAGQPWQLHRHYRKHESGVVHRL